MQERIKLSKIQEMSSLSLHFRQMHVTPVIRIAIQKSLAESIEEIYEPSGELEIEDFESDVEAKLPLPTSTKRRQQDGNKSLV